MWWMFKKLKEDAVQCTYAYARESRSLDGLIEISKDSMAIDVLQPCIADQGSSFCLEKVIEKTHQLIRKKYPDEIQIACG